MARKKSQRGGRASAAAIKRAREQAQQKAAAENKKPISAPATPVRPNIPTSGFTETRGTFTPPTFTPTAPVQPPVRPTVTEPPKPTKPQPKPEVPDETGGVLRPKPVAQTPVSVRRPPVAPVQTTPTVAPVQTTPPVAEQSPVAAQQKTFDAAGSTPGTFERKRQLGPNKWMAGDAGDQVVFEGEGAEEKADAYLDELDKARTARQEFLQTERQPMDTVMSVTTDDGLVSEYTAEGGVREIQNKDQEN